MRCTTLLPLLALLAEPLAVAAQGCKPISSKAFLAKLAASGYDRSGSPLSTWGTAIPIDVQFDLRNLKGVKESGGNARAIGFLSYWWEDPRLAYEDWLGGNCTTHINLRGVDTYRIWDPDLYVDNLVLREVDSELDVGNVASISPNGTVRVTAYRVINVRVNFELLRLPQDMHTGEIVIGSYSYDSNTVVLRPRGGTTEAGLSGAACISPGVNNKVWAIGASGQTARDVLEYEGRPFESQGDVRISLFESGNYSYVAIPWQFVRKNKYFMEQVAFPTVLIVIVCYLQFWVNPDQVPARASLATFPVLMMRAINTMVYGILPKGGQQMWMSDFLLFALTLCVFAGLSLGPVQAFRSVEKHREEKRIVLESNKKGLVQLVKNAEKSGKTFKELLDQYLPESMEQDPGADVAGVPDVAVVPSEATAGRGSVMPRISEAGESAQPVPSIQTPASSNAHSEMPRISVTIPGQAPVRSHELPGQGWYGAHESRGVAGLATTRTGTASHRASRLDPLLHPVPKMKKKNEAAKQDKVTELMVGVLKIIHKTFVTEDRDGSGDLGVDELQRVFRHFDIYMTKRVLAEAACAFLRDNGLPSVEPPQDEEDLQMNLEKFTRFMLEADTYLEMYKLAVPARDVVEWFNSVPNSTAIDWIMRVLFPGIVLCWLAGSSTLLANAIYPYCLGDQCFTWTR